ncbi:MAG TPA: hypothetical protein DDY82_04195 [Clostridiales bacterium]|nr:hypothetical protein [Clostridiales bacterium]HBJ98249.1 hypothetical protein [Clostridiales bacterium]
MTLKGKKSDTRIKLTYVLFGFLLWAGIEGALLFWYFKAPQFFMPIIWLICFTTAVIGYFFILRGFFLNVGSGYELDEKTLTIKDGYPNQKSIIVKISDINEIKTKKVKGLFKFGLGKTIIKVSEKKYVLKNVNFEDLNALTEQVKAKILKEKEGQNEI